ncbi:TPA: HK97 gp10 family phage protein [Streptococcus suis]
MVVDLAAEIADALADWSREIEEEVERIADEVSADAVSTLKSTSPKDTGNYAKSWTRKKLANGMYVIHVKAPYHRLTHLLENGHVKVGGGRTRAQPHIKSVEESSIAEFESRIRSIGQ